jgi:hypothetical protein
MNSKKVLISMLGFGASWSGPADETPWNVYIVCDGQKVLDGGAYPDESPNAILIVSRVKLAVAESVAKALEEFLRNIEIDVQVEMLADA